jgi:hypothetical protein
MVNWDQQRLIIKILIITTSRIKLITEILYRRTVHVKITKNNIKNIWGKKFEREPLLFRIDFCNLSDDENGTIYKLDRR